MTIIKTLKIIFLFYLFSFGQNIVFAEYFIDQDPGLENGNLIDVSSATDVSLSFSLDQSALTAGLHVLYVRVKDSNGQWSISYSLPFYKASEELINPAADISAIEYFIDQDPGFGSGTAVDVSAGSDVNASFSVELAGLAAGFHILYTRAKNSDGHWTIAYPQPFFITGNPAPQAADLSVMEYFIDKDPGLGKATPVSVAAGQSVSGTFAVNLDDVTPGMHVLFTRVKDNVNKWSVSQPHPFFKFDEPKGPPAAISKLKYYFFQHDSVFAEYIIDDFQSGQDIEISFTPDISGINLEEDYDIFIFPIDADGKSGVPFTLNDSMATDSSVVNIIDGVSLIPDKLYMKANYPNPFNPSTIIKFGLPETYSLKIIVFDILGRKVKEIVNATFSAGNYSVFWDGKNDLNQQVASGMYLYKLVTAKKIISRRMLLLR